MGYRSDVALTIYKNDYVNMVAKAVAKGDDYIVNFVTGAIDIYKNGDIVTLYWHDVKWYKEFTEFQFVINYISEIEYSFKRVGEDYDDIEEHCHDDKQMLQCEIGFYTYIDIGMGAQQICVEDLLGRESEDNG